MIRFEDLSVEQALPSLVRTVTRQDVKAYADAGGDQNPLHQDDAAAHAAGFSGVIAHGMFTMGHMAACIVAWCGDPAAITRLSAQFRSPVFLGEEIVAGGRIVELDPASRTAVLETWVTLEREGATHQAVRKGTAVVRIP